MAKSNSPQALTVVSLTTPDDVSATFEAITQFDDRTFGFNHHKTWEAMPVALRGELDPERVASSYAGAHPRVLSCIQGLFTLGRAVRLPTRKFSAYRDSGLRNVETIDWSPEVGVRVRGECWYVVDDIPHIPLLQPRKEALNPERLAVFAEISRHAYCKDVWSDAQINIVDLSGDDPTECARFVDMDELPAVSDDLIRSYIETYVAAKKQADAHRASKKAVVALKKTPLEAFLDE